MERHDAHPTTLSTLLPLLKESITISKQVQWLYPDLYGEDKLLMMIGALHIEMCFLSTIGDWLDGSGWVELLVNKISTRQEEQKVCFKARRLNVVVTFIK